MCSKMKFNGDVMEDKKELLLIKVDEGVELTATEKSYRDITSILIYSIFTAVSGSFVCGFAAGYSSPVQSAILKDLCLTTAEYSLFGSILTVGGLLGALVSGKLADAIGRRGTMGISSILSIGGWLSVVYTQGTGFLDIGRLTLGFACGIISYVVPVYIAEITPKNYRGGSVLLHQLMLGCGIATAFLVGLITSWRVLALIGTIPCLIQLLGLCFIPESPRWLVKSSSEYVYEVALRRLRGKNIDISQEAAGIKEYTEAVESISNDNFFNLFRVKYAYALIVCLGLMALAGFGGTNAILFYATALFESARFSGTIGTIAMALIQLPTTALGVFLMDKYGRRPLLLFSAAGMATACLFVASSFFLKAHGWMTNFSPYLALIGILIFAATYPVGMGGVPFVIMSEIFPINIKGAAGSLATVVSFSSSWIVTYTFNFMMQWSSSGTFFVFTCVNVFSLLFVAKLVPETKGRTLEEIQELISYK
ncbi:sugar transporter ERD6-like 5 [Beta vulgaris subsp. vulgaris]|uniref:sugar transporter ERD6-like 5 n=1 Tax=Beta vulgaris subsp. vulgaris TaxID=3555 RepID=UPI0020367151|nr:sugar transporter ERD6-like 5 [Beta vulgaris subsp. vulgaris]